MLTAGLLLATPAGGQPPSKLTDHITDSSGVLTDSARTAVSSAIDRLYRDQHIQLWVAYVDNFSRFKPDNWADQTRSASAMGDHDVLLAVATNTKLYAFSVPPNLQGLTAAELSSLRSNRIEPAVSAKAGKLAKLVKADLAAYRDRRHRRHRRRGHTRRCSPAPSRASPPARRPQRAGEHWRGRSVVGAGVVHRGRQIAPNLRLRRQAWREHRRRGPGPARRRETAFGSRARQARKQRHRSNCLCQQGVDAGRPGTNAGKRRRASAAPHATTSRHRIYAMIGGITIWSERSSETGTRHQPWPEICPILP